MFAGFAGSFFATRQGFISPESFVFIESATILAFVVLGGMGSQIGVVIAAFFLVVVPEIFREFAEYRRSEEHTSELQSLMRISYAVFCLKKKKRNTTE